MTSGTVAKVIPVVQSMSLALAVTLLSTQMAAAAAPKVDGATTKISQTPEVSLPSDTLWINTTLDPRPPVVSPAPTMVEYRVVGYTKAYFTGNPQFADRSGLHAVNEACQQDFGRQARAATIEDAGKPPLQVLGDRLPKRGWLVVGEVDVRYNGLDSYWPVSHGFGVGIGRENPLHADSGAGCFRLRTDDEDFRGPVYTRDSSSESMVETQSCAASIPFTCSVPVALEARYRLTFHAEEAY